jgi:hypothetical protein
MKILIIGGMHGNEPLGQQLVKRFQTKPIQDVDILLANEQAIKADSRFIKNDLNRSFPGQANSLDYETRRAAEILQKTRDYDIVLDFHNTHCPDNDCGFVGNAASQLVYDIASWLGLARIVIADYECINKYAQNCLSVEISLDSDNMAARIWYLKIAKLAQLETIPPATKLQKFRFVYRMTLEDKKQLNLPEWNLKAFQEIDNDLAETMSVNAPAYPIFIADEYTPYNYGGLLNEV